MIRPDVVLTWGQHMDYPYARYMLERFAPYFNEVYIGLTNHGKLENYSQFLINNIDAKFKTIPIGEGDWRNNAVRTMLEESQAAYVLFLEQDFLIRDQRFLEVLLNVSDYNFLYYNEQGRLHPACALVPRPIIEKTSKDFSARPPAYDHFGLFFKEVLRLTNSADLETIGLLSKEDYFHAGGLTQNYHVFTKLEQIYKTNEFLTINHYSMKLPILYNEFKIIMEQVDELYSFEESEADESLLPFFPKK